MAVRSGLVAVGEVAESEESSVLHVDADVDVGERSHE